MNIEYSSTVNVTSSDCTMRMDSIVSYTTYTSGNTEIAVSPLINGVEYSEYIGYNNANFWHDGSIYIPKSIIDSYTHFKFRYLYEYDEPMSGELTLNSNTYVYSISTLSYGTYGGYSRFASSTVGTGNSYCYIAFNGGSILNVTFDISYPVFSRSSLYFSSIGVYHSKQFGICPFIFKYYRMITSSSITSLLASTSSIFYGPIIFNTYISSMNYDTNYLTIRNNLKFNFTTSVLYIYKHPSTYDVSISMHFPSIKFTTELYAIY